MLFFLLRSGLRSTSQLLTERLEREESAPQAPEYGTRAAPGTALQVEQPPLTDEEKDYRLLQDQVLQFTENNPEDAIRLLRTWYVNTEQS
jgi:flagellar biosynthesis/type III secretory pathway M-ring protein FliF/YscJ